MHFETWCFLLNYYIGIILLVQSCDAGDQSKFDRYIISFIIIFDSGAITESYRYCTLKMSNVGLMHLNG